MITHERITPTTWARSFAKFRRGNPFWADHWYISQKFGEEREGRH
jgi:hypothetical protein